MEQQLCDCASLRGEVAELRRELTLMQDGWKLFDSAPNDAVVELLYPDGEVLAATYDRGYWYTTDGQNAHRPWEHEPDPTHWRPLPA